MAEKKPQTNKKAAKGSKAKPAKQAAKKPAPKKAAKKKPAKVAKKPKNQVHDMGIVIVDDEIEVDQERVNEERRAFLEEARSQEVFD